MRRKRQAAESKSLKKGVLHGTSLPKSGSESVSMFRSSEVVGIDVGQADVPKSCVGR